ncbi:hypothetical protein L6164_002863 [Bauhinia variegata]|uniref:Uncharacterized protein n=1 Tax=Bauhinia variegata TaxID=167791 RepID=A0ACB9Q511_BAUVA|nr:hypothetical protein L6164_002863 [Bauhinia variegata]
MSGGEGEVETLEFTPTWVVAAVCTVIVALSIIAERFLHYGGKFLKKNQKPLYEALQKIKELMLLGFISPLQMVSQNAITKICVPPAFAVLRLVAEATVEESEEVSTAHCCARKIQQWKHWEDEIAKSTVPQPKLTNVQQLEFIKDRFLGFETLPQLFMNGSSYFES